MPDGDRRRGLVEPVLQVDRFGLGDAVHLRRAEALDDAFDCGKSARAANGLTIVQSVPLLAS